MAWHFGDWREWRILASAALFSIPPLTIGGQAFVQRFFFGKRTKRISVKVIRELRWDGASAPYRLRQLLEGLVRGMLLRLPKNDRDIPDPGWGHSLSKVLAFVPTVIVMLIPAGIGWLTLGHGPTQRLPVGAYVPGLAVFSGYLICCAIFELVSAWRTVLLDLGLVSR